MTNPADASSLDDFNTKLIAEFRANGGKVGGNFAGANLLVLTTTGAKSGLPRVSPLAYRREGDHVVVFGSYAGKPRHPAWFHNLVAHPDVTVETGTETYRARARVAEGDERERIWRAQVADIPQFGEYEKTTEGRRIPVVVLERR
jgi:deazaflavin-dependent oxidoreductase (nitroreductase family)